MKEKDLIAFHLGAGGLVGLFSGMSILSVIEIIFWCFKLLQTLSNSLKPLQSRQAGSKAGDGETGKHGVKEDGEENFQSEKETGTLSNNAIVAI